VPNQTVDHSPQSSVAATGSNSAEHQSLLHSIQSVLHQIDEEYEREREKLSRTLPDASVKARVLTMLKERHRERREPYIQQLAALQGRAQ
jgi:hypothetical protein